MRPLWRACRLMLVAAPGAMLRGLLLAVLVLLAGAALLGLSGWLITAAGLAGAAGVGHAFNVLRPAAGVRALALGRTGARYGERLLTHDATLRALAGMRVAVLRGHARQPGQALLRLRVEAVLMRIVGDVDALDGLILRLVGPVIAGLAAQLLAFAALWWLAGLWVAAVVPLIALPAAALILWRSARRTRRLADRAERRAQRLQRDLIDALRDREALILAGLLPRREAALIARDSTLRRDVARLDRAERRAGFGLSLTTTLAAAAALIAGGIAVERGLDPARAAVVFFVALALAETIQPLRRAAAEAGRMAGAAARLGLEPPSPCPARPALPPAPTLIVDRPEAQFTLAPGEALALTGPSGSGKSLLLLAIAGLGPSEGISLHGRAPQAWDEPSLRRRLTLLPQRSALIAGSVRDNLTLARDHDDAALWRVLEAVALHDDIAARGGLDTPLSEGGRGLSGGQSRRLAIARAVLSAPDLLLLDEPTEGLDPTTAEAVLAGIRAALPQATLIVALHRGADHAIFDRTCRLREKWRPRDDSNAQPSD